MELSEGTLNMTFMFHYSYCWFRVLVKRMFDIDYKYDNTLKRIYLTARDTKSGPVSVFLPICSSENVTFSMMEKMFSTNEYNTYVTTV